MFPLFNGSKSFFTLLFNKPQIVNVGSTLKLFCPTIFVVKPLFMKYAIILFPFVLMLGCTSKETETLRTENDSLRAALSTNREVMATLQEVGSMIDSIDASRKLLKISMLEGTTKQDYTARLQAIHEHVMKSGQKIEALEQSLKSATQMEGFYLDMIGTLKNELEIRLQEIYSLEKVNQELEAKVKVQEGDLHESLLELEKKKQELARQELAVDQLVNKLKLSEAETNYAKGSALEATANRIKLAPAKKKATLREAVGYYRKAADLGKKEAFAKLKALEGKY
jgi:chromosome segregation ATPase